MTVRGLAGWLMRLPGERIDTPPQGRRYGWWLRGESGVLWRRLPAAALAGWGPGGVEAWSGRLNRDSSLQRDVLSVGPRRPGIARFYDSGVAAGGMFGAGWRTSWDVAIDRRGDDLVYHDEWGHATVVPCPAPGSLVVLAALSLTFACLEDGRFVVADLGPVYRQFSPVDAAGRARLAAIEHIDGYRIEIERNERGVVTGLTDGGQEGVWCSTDARDQVTAVARNRTVQSGLRFSYGPDGRLATVAQSGGKTLRRYGYQNGLLAEICEADGNWSVRWRDEGRRAAVAGVREPSGQMWLRQPDAQRRSVSMVSADGNALRWMFDEHDRVVQYVDAKDKSYQVAYDGRGRPVSVVTAAGDYTFAYDDLGRVVQESGPGGFSRKVSYAYASRRPMLISRNGSRHWFWMRDAQLRPLQRREPSGEVSVYTYDDKTGGRTRTAPGGVVEDYFDECGRLKLRLLPAGGKEAFVWSAQGQLRARSNEQGVLEAREYDEGGGLRVRRGQHAQMRLMAYDRRGRLLALSNAAGHARHWAYDSRGRLELQTDEEGNSTRYSRSRTGSDLVVQGPAGGTQRWSRDPGRRVCSRHDADGVVVEYHQDIHGHTCRVLELGASARAETCFDYDSDGRVANKECQGHRWSYRYDGTGRLTTLRATTPSAEESLLTFEYGAGNRALRETGALGSVTTTWDTLGHLVSIELPCGLAILATRDDGQGVTQLSYVHEGQPVVILTVWHDSAGRERARVAGNLQRRIRYDAEQGLRVEHADRVSGKGGAVESLMRRLRHDMAGRLVAVEGGCGSILYDYDRRGQLVRTIAESGILYTSWNASGNIIALDGSGWVPSPLCPDHLVKRVGQWAIAYDEWGRVVRREGNGTVATFSWDALGRLVTAQANGVTVFYTYDAAGRLIGRRRADQNEADTHALIWQGLRLIQECTPARRVTYLYEPAPAGCVSYAPMARLIQRRSYAHMPWSEPVVQYLFADAAGRVHAIADEDGRVQVAADQRPWGALEAWTGGEVATMPPDLAGQWSDPDTMLRWNGTRFYDPATARYMSPDRDAPAGVSPYRYVSAPVSQANPRGYAVRAAGIGQSAGVAPRWTEPAAWAGSRAPAFSEPA